MAHELNSLLNQGRMDVVEQFRAYLFVLLNRKGNILKIWENTSFPHPQDIVESIKENNDIFKSFDFGGLADLNKVPDGPLRYPDRLEHLRTDVLGDFYSELPFCRISINKIDDDRFVGAIRLTAYFPNVSYGFLSAMIFTDDLDRLIG